MGSPTGAPIAGRARRGKMERAREGIIVWDVFGVDWLKAI